MNSWPEDFFSFAFVPDSSNKFEELAQMAEDEDWGYHNTPSSYARPILFNYIKYTYKRVAEEGKIALSPDGQFCCFNTGLVTSTQEPIYASFDANRQQDKQPWFFKGWFRKGRWELNKFDELPDMAHYFDDPSCLVLDYIIPAKLEDCVLPDRLSKWHSVSLFEATGHEKLRRALRKRFGELEEVD